MRMTATSRLRIRARRLGAWTYKGPAVCAGPAYRITKDQCSSRERRSAAAAAGGVRILERKSGFLEIALVVHHRAVQVLRAEFIDEQPHARAFNHHIVRARLLFDVQAVAEAGATARQHRDAQAGRL